jgi:hypothetical protein
VAANEVRFAAYRTSAAAVLSQIASAKHRGYNLREVGLVQGTKSLSTWIKTPDGRPAAAITVSAVRARLGPRREQEVTESLLGAALAIEEENHVSLLTLRRSGTYAGKLRKIFFEASRMAVGDFVLECRRGRRNGQGRHLGTPFLVSHAQ